MKHLRAKCGEAVKESVDSKVADFRKLQRWLYELAHPELTAVYAERLDERREHSDSIETPKVRREASASRLYRDADYLLGNFAVKRDTWPAVSSEMVSATRS